MFSTFALFNKKDKNKLIKLIFFELISVLAELFSIGLLPIFILLIIDTQKLRDLFSEYFSIHLIINDNKLIIYFTILLIIVFLIKIIYLILINYYKNYLYREFFKEKSYKLFNKYIYSSYNFHLKKNPSELFRNITLEVENLRNFFKNIVELFKGLIFLVSAMMILFLTDFKITLVIFFTFLSTITIYIFYFKNKITLYSKNIQNHRKIITKHINETFNSIKFILISNKQKFFNYFFYNELNSLEEYSLKYNNISFIPRHIIELAAVCLLIFVTLLSFFQDKNLLDEIPKLTLYGVIIIKLIPYFGMISTALSELRFSKVSVDLLINEFANDETIFKIQKKNTNKFEFKKIELKNVYFSYDNQKKINLNNISLNIKKNEIVGIIGPSGAGKSTLLDLILGILKPSKGKIFINDIHLDIVEKEWQEAIGYVPQEPYLLDDTIFKNVAFGLKEEEISINKFEKCLRKAQLQDFVKLSENGHQTMLGNRGIRLSGGQKQRLSIARALYNNPQVIILDEATNSLDKKTENEFFEVIKDLKKSVTVILISHSPDTIKFCDNVIKIEDGMLCE